MHAQTTLLLALSAVSSVVANPVARQASEDSQLAALAAEAQQKTEKEIQAKADANSKRDIPYLSRECNPSNVRVRKEW